ncbi:hypothetical protein JCM11251_003223 [Rhodosporidiobolus azoricus]
MEHQQARHDPLARSHSPSAPLSLNEDGEVRASLSTLPLELKLKVVEEVYRDVLKVPSLGAWIEQEKINSSTRLTVDEAPTDLAALSVESREWHALCAPKLWETIGVYAQSLIALPFLLAEILPKYGGHVRTLRIDFADEAQLFTRPMDMDEFDIWHARTGLRDLARELNDDARGIDDEEDVLDVLAARAVRQCGNIHTLALALGDDMVPRPRLFRAIKVQSRVWKIRSLRLAVGETSQDHVAQVEALFASSTFLRHLTLVFPDYLTGNVFRVAALISRFSSLRSLTLDNLTAQDLARLHLSSPLEYLHLRSSKRTIYELTTFQNFLAPFAEALHTLILDEVVAYAEGSLHSFNLPRLRHLAADFIPGFFPLDLFRDSPISHLQIETGYSNLPTLLLFLKGHSSTMRECTYAGNELYVHSSNMREVETQFETIKQWCTVNKVEYRFPSLQEMQGDDWSDYCSSSSDSS